MTGRKRLTEVEFEAVELLTMLVEEYEDRVHPIPAATPLEVLRCLMEQHKLMQKDLVPKLGSESNVSQI